jgi:hypothetical protein
MKVRLPLRERDAGGIACPSPEVTLRVRDRLGAFAPLRFRVDTQSDLSVIPLPLARKEGLHFSEADPVVVRGLVGTTQAYRGRLRLLIAGREHDWPCHFVLPPPGPGGTALEQPVLGRAGFLDEFAVAIDAGFLILTRLGPIRRRVRAFLHWVWDRLGMIHDRRQPL